MNEKKKPLRILLIDDHPLIVESYKAGLELYEEEFDVPMEIVSAEDCDQAIACIDDSKPIDIAFLDIQIPRSKTNDKIQSGEDVGMLLRKKHKDTKIVVITTIRENYVIQNILFKINPEGFMIKSDVSHKEIAEGIDNVLKAPPYYSKTVLKHLRNEVASPFSIDVMDRKILYELSVGTLTSEMENYIPLSQSSIKRRKRNLKIMFDLEEAASDRDLILKAKEWGLL